MKTVEPVPEGPISIIHNDEQPLNASEPSIDIWKEIAPFFKPELTINLKPITLYELELPLNISEGHFAPLDETNSYKIDRKPDDWVAQEILLQALTINNSLIPDLETMALKNRPRFPRSAKRIIQNA